MKFSTVLVVFFSLSTAAAKEINIWMELKAKNQHERSVLADQGFDIVAVEEDRVIVLGDEDALQRAEKMNLVMGRFLERLSPFDFPNKDEKFHNYTELTAKLNDLVGRNPQFMQMTSIGKTGGGRDIWAVRLSLAAPGTVPASILMGGHHAREHVSVEIPLRLIGYFADEYNKQNPRIVSLLNNYEVFIIPSVNPDGKEFDVATGKYQSWRKNRTNNGDGTYGVDLNRNYGYFWGGGGASKNSNDETYRGPSAFSENETKAIKAFVEAHPNIKTLLTFHTFSKLILWPWGYQTGEVSNADDMAVFKTMGNTMAQWNGYRPMQSSGLYVASGDTCDWAYGERGIFAFTFELDPDSMWSGGFYPGQGILDSVFNKNLEPALYLIETADNPYKVLKPWSPGPTN